MRTVVKKKNMDKATKQTSIKASRFLLMTVAVAGAQFIGFANPISLPTDTIPTETEDEGIQLKEIVVSAKNVTRVDDHLLVLPTKNQKAHAFNAFEALDNVMIPGLQVSGESISYMGKGTVLYLNGMKCSPEDITRLRPQDIEKIEIHDFPTGIYAGDGCAINFVMKKRDRGGYVLANAQAKAGVTDDALDIAASYSHGNSTIRVFGGGDIKNIGHSHTSLAQQYRLSDMTVDRDLFTTSRQKSNSQYAQLRWDYSTKKRSMITKASLVTSRQPSLDQTGQALSRASDASDFDISQYQSRATKQNVVPSLDFSGIFHIGENHTLLTNAEFKYARNHSEWMYQENGLSSESKQKEDSYEGRVGASYITSFGQWSFVGSISNYYSLWDTKSLLDFPSTQRIWQDQLIARATITKAFSSGYRLNLSGGASMLFNKVAQDKVYKNISPRWSISLEKNFNGTMASLGCVMNSYSYSASTLGTTIVEENPWLLKTGNPHLKNSTNIIPSISLYKVVDKITMVLVGNYNHTFRYAVDSYSLYGDRLMKSFAMADFDEISANLSVGWRPNQKYNLAANLTYNNVYANPLKGRKCSSLYGSMSARAFWGKFSVNVYASTWQKTVVKDNLSIVKLEPVYSMSLSYAHKDLKIRALAKCPFTKCKTRTSVELPLYSSYATDVMRDASRIVTFTIQYSFDYGSKKVDKINLDIDRDPNSSILK